MQYFCISRSPQAMTESADRSLAMMGAGKWQDVIELAGRRRGKGVATRRHARRRVLRQPIEQLSVESKTKVARKRARPTRGGD